MQLNEIQVEARGEHATTDHLTLVHSKDTGVFDAQHLLENITSTYVNEHFVKEF
jgi:hypothetical protein